MFKYKSAIDIEDLATLLFSDKSILDYVSFTSDMERGCDFQISQEVTVSPLESQGETEGMLLGFCGLSFKFMLSPMRDNHKRTLRVKFLMAKGQLSSVLKFT